jgi:hypothetical protein
MSVKGTLNKEIVEGVPWFEDRWTSSLSIVGEIVMHIVIKVISTFAVGVIRTWTPFIIFDKIFEASKRIEIT